MVEIALSKTFENTAINSRTWKGNSRTFGDLYELFVTLRHTPADTPIALGSNVHFYLRAMKNNKDGAQHYIRT